MLITICNSSSINKSLSIRGVKLKVSYSSNSSGSGKGSDLVGYINSDESSKISRSIYVPGLNVPSFMNLINILIREDLTVVEKSNLILPEIEGLIKGLRSINSKGFVNSKELYDYPYVSEYLPHILELPVEAARMQMDYNSLSSLLSTKNKIFVYKWVYNIINLRMFSIIEYLLKELEDLKDKDKLEDPIYYVYKDLRNSIYNSLDPAIRRHLTRRGISIIHNIYTGFDTEYDNIDERSNELLSVQLATTYKILLKLPLRTEFNYEELNIGENTYYNYEGSSLDGDDSANLFKLAYSNDDSYKEGEVQDEDDDLKSKDNKGKDKEDDSESVKKDFIKIVINDGINFIRSLKYKTYDYVLGKLIKGLKKRNFDFIERGDDVYFVFEKEKLIKEWFRVIDEMSLKDIVRITKSLNQEDYEKDLDWIYKLLKEIVMSDEEVDSKDSKKAAAGAVAAGGAFEKGETSEVGKENKEDEDKERIKVNYEIKDLKYEDLNIVCSNFDVQNASYTIPKDNKKYTRTYNQSISKERISITKKTNNYLLSHLTNADLSMLSDFNEFKEGLDIVNKSFVTLSKPLLIEGVNLIVRDTMLLAPGGKKSLDSIGKMYDIEKIEIPSEYRSQMGRLLEEDRELFEKYAKRDALISLIHGYFMDSFYGSIGGLGVPITLSGLSSSYIRKFWKDKNYKGYQAHPKYDLGNVSNSFTPKGFSKLKDVGLFMNFFISCYKGGRNETFMYGKDDSTCWYDYDLVSAYTTIMSGLGTPDYRKGRLINAADLRQISFDKLVNSYTVLNVEFDYIPEDYKKAINRGEKLKIEDIIKYPALPCSLDETTTLYPLTGRTVISGHEYLVAKLQGCSITVINGVHIPFLGDQPFADCIKELQFLRNQHPKGSIKNLLYKEIGNSLYGLTVRGINNKVKYDLKSKSMKRMEGNELANPLIANWITSFVRALMGELLHTIHRLGGRAISVTTDGFLTDIEDLEDKFLEYHKKNNSFDSILLPYYKELRKWLTEGKNDRALELKHSGKGILSWCTRGQISEGANLMAMTGYQRGSNTISDVYKLVEETMGSEEKSFMFLTKQLRSAKEIYLHGGQVTMKYSDQIYRVMYDNKRFIIDEIEGKRLDPTETLLDSKPLEKVEEGRLLRYVSNLPKSVAYAKTTSIRMGNKYHKTNELVYRNFVKALLNNELNLDLNQFKNYKEIVEFVKIYWPDSKISTNYIAQLKRRGNYVKVPRNDFSLGFVDYVKERFPNFDSENFLEK